MPGPTPEERKAVQKRHLEREAHLKAADKRADEIHHRVQGLIQETLAHRARKDFSREGILEGLEDARRLAMAIGRPADAVSALMAMAKLEGLIIDRSVQAIGTPEQFALTGDIDAARSRAHEALKERFGSKSAQRLLSFVKQLERDPET